MHPIRVLCSIAVFSLASGCSSYPRLVPLPPSKELAGDMESYEASQRRGDAVPLRVQVEEPTGPITLRQALALALMRSPDLGGAWWDVRAAEAKLLGAGLLPNPELEVETENLGGTGALRGLRSAETTIALGQLIELGGKRTKRLRLAGLERELAGWDYEARRIDVYAQTARAFVDLLASQQKVALAEELMRISQRVYDTADELVNSGKAPPLERSKAQVALGASKLQLERARRESAALRRRLAATWGATEAKFAAAAGEFEMVAAIPTEAQLASLIAQNPDIARWKTEMEQRQAALALERAKAVPDLTIRGGIKRLEDTEDTGFLVGFAMALPVFDRNQGGIRESMAKLAKASEQRRAAESKAHSDLAVAYQAMASAFAEATILKNDILPASQQAFDAASEGYRQGKYRYLDVLDAQRTLYEAKAQQIAALAEYHTAVADVERLTGEKLSAMRGTTPSTKPVDRKGERP